MKLCVLAWKEMLQIAQAYGWEPTGTYLPRKKPATADGTTSVLTDDTAGKGASREMSGASVKTVSERHVRIIVEREWYLEDGRWSGSYMANGGQVVSRKDAMEIGKALTRMIFQARREHGELREKYSDAELEQILEDADGRLIHPSLRNPPHDPEEAMRRFVEVMDEEIYHFDPRTGSPVDRQAILRRNLNLDWLREIFAFSRFCFGGKFEIW
jgi:hypothetical protein